MTSIVAAYMKPTNYCNVGCHHCYLPEEVRANKSRMDDVGIEKSSQLILDMVESRRAYGAHIIWHGGEPLTIPVDWYYRAADILKKKNPNITQSIQTSLIPYTSEYAQLAHDMFDGQMGSSIDFSQRQIKGSNERYQELWLSKVSQARSDGLIITPGMVPTKSDVSRAAELVDWFVENDFSHFNIDRYNCFGTEDFTGYPSNAEHSQFMISMFDRVMTLIDTTGVSPTVNVISAAINGIEKGIPGDRWGGTCQSDFVVIEPDGKLNSCPDRISFEESFGNLDGGFESFSANPTRKKWIRIQSVGHQNDYCSGCENNSWCKTGCPISCNDLKEDSECAGYKSFITHVRQYIQSNRENIIIYMNQGR